MLQVNAATAAQLDEYVAWLLASAHRMVGRGIRQWTPESIEAQRTALAKAQRDGAIWLVSDAAGPLGGALALPHPDSALQELWWERPEVARCVYFQKVVLEPGHRLRGSGRSMLAALERHARDAGFDHVRLDCVAHDTSLQRAYERAGYYPVGVVPAFGTLGSFGLKMLGLEKDLSAAQDLVQALEDWRPELTGTLLFVIDGESVLLIDKKTGHGAGKINAPGGKLEAAESPAACAVRETFEEVGLQVQTPRLMARLKFADTVATQWFGYVFVADTFTGTAVESREADPHWYALDAIPYERMWEDDRIWLPLVLAGQQVQGEFLFNDGKLRAHRLA